MAVLGPTLAEVRDWIQVAATILDDEQLAQVLDAETTLQSRLCRLPDDSAGDVDLPPALVQALYRRVQRHIAAKAVPLGLVGDGEYGPARLPSYDAEISRLEASYRIPVVA